MKTELLIFLIVVFVAAIPLVQIGFTGLQTYSGYTLADYPYLFGQYFDAAIIKGSTSDSGEVTAVNLFLTVLPVYYRVTQRPRWQEGYYQIFPEKLIGKTFRENEIDYTTTDAIVIGTPCHNSVVAKLLNIVDCQNYFQPGQGLVKLVEANNHTYLVATGYSGVEIWAISNYFMAESQLGRPKTTELRVNSIKNIANMPLRTGKPEWQAGYRPTAKNELNILGGQFYIVK